jgi:4'-phosphopantetheinyl transferase
LKLAPHEIHVWLAFDRELDDPALNAAHAALMSAEEDERRRKLYSEELRHQFLVTRALQRIVLSQYAPDVEPRAWSFITRGRGKPALAPEFDAHGLHFNLAHTKGLVAFALSRLPEIGIDVENVHARTAPLHLAPRYFTEREAAALTALPERERPARFHALWTLKESWLKATGEGLAAGLGNASFDLDDAHRLRSVEFAKDDASRWRFWQHRPSDEHTLAVALRAEPVPTDAAISFYTFDEGTFIEK